MSGYLSSLQHTSKSCVRWDATAYPIINTTQYHYSCWIPTKLYTCLPTFSSNNESHCAWSHQRLVSLNQTVGEAHNRHLLLLACSQMMFFEVLSPTKEHSSAAAQHGSASLPVLNKTWMTGRSHTRLSNPTGSGNKREVAISHYSCAALPPSLWHFTWQALLKDGDQSYMLSMRPAPFSVSQ